MNTAGLIIIATPLALAVVLGIAYLIRRVRRGR
jgi:hypothetical protein